MAGPLFVPRNYSGQFPGRLRYKVFDDLKVRPRSGFFARSLAPMIVLPFHWICPNVSFLTSHNLSSLFAQEQELSKLS